MADDTRQKTSLALSALVVTAVFVGVGLPMWWMTTSVYRADLPLEAINELSTVKPNYKINVTLVVPGISLGSSATIIRALLDVLTINKTSDEAGNLRPSAGYSVSARPARQTELRVFQMSFGSISELDEVMWHEVETQPGGYLVYQLPKDVSLYGSKPSIYVGQHRCIYITHGLLEAVLPRVAEIFEQVVVNTDMVSAAYIATTDSQQINKRLKAEVMTAVRSKPGYRISFSLLNPEPNRFQVGWNIRTATREYLHPLLDRLAVMGKFTVESQILRYVNLGVTPKLDNKEKGYYLTQAELPHTINPVESRLGTYVSSDPSIDFLVYVPPLSQFPLYIVDEGGERVASNAFLSPRWGGILVYNLNKSEDVQVVDVPMEEIMPVFVSELRLLLGMSNLKPSLQDVLIAEPHSTGISDWELDGLLLRRCMENIATTTATLTSLIQLLEEVKNMVIADQIQTQVVKATDSIAECHRHMKSGRLLDAFLLSKQAIESSETAFFDPSMLALLYFPEDQKFAIYVPLFVPVSLPLLLSTGAALKHLFKGKDKSAKQQTDETDSIMDKTSTETSS